MRYFLDPRTDAAHYRFVREALDAAGWERTDGDDWTLWWGGRYPPAPVFRALRPGRFVNHLPGIPAITRKDTLSWALEIARRERPRGSDRRPIHPATYVLPEDHADFLTAARRAPGALWIDKPVSSSNGRGIRMVEDPLRVRPRAGRLVQRYVSRPHLLDGFKYSLRFYLAIVGAERLDAALFEDGFCKLTTRPFTTARTSLRDRLVHLTNPEVQETNAEVPTSSRNLTHVGYRARLRDMGVDDRALWGRIEVIARETVVSAREFVRDRAARALRREAGRPFELLGLDIVIDRDLRPWLIECNLGPSLAVEADPTTPSARAEHDVKRRVVADMLRFAGVIGDGAESGGFRRLG